MTLFCAALAMSQLRCAPQREPQFSPAPPPPGSLRARGSGSGASAQENSGLGGPGANVGGPSSGTVRDAGLATWYGAQLAGRKTASGERFDPDALTAAHRTLPFGTWVEVRRTSGSSRAVRVRINDRGPFGDHKRVIDVSRKAAQILDMVKDGVVPVEVRVVSGPD